MSEIIPETEEPSPEPFLYAKSTGGFYLHSLHGEAVPDDSVELSAADHAALMAGQSQGGTIVADGNGKPMLTYKPLPSLEDVKLMQVAAINAAYNDAMLGGCMTSLGFRMDCTFESLLKLKLAYDYAVLLDETAMPIVDYDNVVHMATPMADALKIIKELGKHFRDLYMLKQKLRGDVLAAATAEAAAAVVWP